MAELTEASQAFNLHAAGFCLRALGRLVEAVQPMQAGLDARIAREKWSNAAVAASTLTGRTVIWNMPGCIWQWVKKKKMHAEILILQKR